MPPVKCKAKAAAANRGHVSSSPLLAARHRCWPPQPAASSSGAPLPPVDPKDASAGFIAAPSLGGDVVQQKPAKKAKNVVLSWENTVLESLRRELPPHLYARLHTAAGKAPKASAVVQEGGVLVHVTPFGLGGEGALLDNDGEYLLPTLQPVEDDSLQTWIEPRSFSKADKERIKNGRQPTCPKFAWVGTSVLGALQHVIQRGMTPSDGSSAAPGFTIFLLGPAAGADYLSFDNWLTGMDRNGFGISPTGFCVQTSDSGAPIGRAAVEISRLGARAVLRYSTYGPKGDPKVELAAALGGYGGFDDYYERGALPAIKLALEKHPETLAKLPLEGDAVSSARVLDKGDGFLVHVMQRQIDGNGFNGHGPAVLCVVTALRLRPCF